MRYQTRKGCKQSKVKFPLDACVRDDAAGSYVPLSLDDAFLCVVADFFEVVKDTVDYFVVRFTGLELELVEMLLDVFRHLDGSCHNVLQCITVYKSYGEKLWRRW